jgi:hypothetical protein
MAAIITLEDRESVKESSISLDLDSFFGGKYKKQMRRKKNFDVILNRVLKRIKHEGLRPNSNTFHTTFQVPMIVLGESEYDKEECVVYLMDQLQERNLDVRFLPPRTLYISWKNYVPTYVRQEIRSKTGITLDERGRVLSAPETEEERVRVLENGRQVKEKKQYTPLDQVRPLRDTIYDQEYIDSVARRLGGQTRRNV